MSEAKKVLAELAADKEELVNYILYALNSFNEEYLHEPTHWDDTPTRRRCALILQERLCKHTHDDPEDAVASARFSKATDEASQRVKSQSIACQRSAETQYQKACHRSIETQDPEARQFL